jgi:GGDEF domain-containing protein
VLGDTGVADELGVRTLEQRLRRAFDEPFELGCGSISLGASIGLAHADGDTVAGLLARADQAMYADKRRRKSPAEPGSI